MLWELNALNIEISIFSTRTCWVILDDVGGFSPNIPTSSAVLNFVRFMTIVTFILDKNEKSPVFDLPFLSRIVLLIVLSERKFQLC